MRDLRRYFASILLSEGSTLDSVGQLLGHTQTQTTRRYAYLMQGAGKLGVESAANYFARLKTDRSVGGNQ